MLAESISRDMDLDPDDLAPRLAAAAMTAILDLLSDERRQEGASTSIPDDLEMRLLDQGLEFVAAGVDALRADGPEGVRRDGATMSVPAPILTEGLSKHFGDVKALVDLDLEVRAG